ncbi:capsular biosynthesis protein [Allopontixanthobacter sp.]|uniref:capsular biosynthesis protein n=1 Tax=Allopontixanthobacter sp. TaxID=2906452 RepID=UPI002ABB5B6C|nr:capsular biosynthesis protein [Allopontixanthobacter sp.]MDZ4308061.1 capsular biosynthesis protein [Allopontixanthobacter sp.]
MTEHRKIPVPGSTEAPSDTGSSSLFERASGVFGLDPFKGPPVPRKLADPPLKHARLRQPSPAPEFVPEPVPKPAPAPAPIAVLPSQVTLTGETGSVRLSGTRHPVSREHLRDQGMIVPEGSVTALIEEFRIVKRQILSAARERGTAKSRRILICSPHPGEGKTFCATNLAIAMAAERDSEVLLVDADFAKPSILSTLGLPKGPGLMDCLADPSLKPESLVIGTDIPGLWVLPAGSQTAYDSEYLGSARTAEVMDRLTVGAPDRIVIFDSPPALSASPAAELAKHVGQAVLVVRADSSGQSAVEDAVHLLSACADIKLLLNATNFSPSGRNFGAYYGYGA